MEENGNDGYRPTITDTGDVIQKTYTGFQKDLKTPNVGVVSDILENELVHETETLPNKVNVRKHATFCEDKEHSEELPELQDLHVKSDVNDEKTAEEGYVGEHCVPTITTNSGNVSLVASTNVRMSTDEEGNITSQNDGGNDWGMHELMTSYKTELHNPKTFQSDVPQKAPFNAEMCELSEKNENSIIRNENGEKRFSNVRSHLDCGKDKETCIYCTRENSRGKTESLDIAFQDFNIDKQDTMIVDNSCSICTLNLSNNKSIPPLDNKDLQCENSKRENEEISETDVTRPASRMSEKSNTSSSVSGNSETIRKKKRENVPETDLAILSRRQKQIEYGKNTIGYHRYKEMVPKDQRKRENPVTPPKSVKYSRRAWDGLIKAWRRKLHNWDPQKSEASDDEGGSVVSSSSSSFPASDDSENFADVPNDTGEQLLSNEMEIQEASMNEDSNTHK